MLHRVAQRTTEVHRDKDHHLKEYTLNIAGYAIRFESSDIDLVPGKRFENYCPSPALPKLGGWSSCPEHAEHQSPPIWGDLEWQTGDSGEQIHGDPGMQGLSINVFPGEFKIPSRAARVFHAPYVEEVEGVRYLRNPEFWSIWKYDDELYITTTFPQSSDQESAVLKFSLQSNLWELWIKGKSNKADPFEYPLDGLVLYYLTVVNKDIMIHASGVNHNGKGYLFSGISGQGKSTMARIWNDAGAKVIHDDRLIIRREGGRYKMYNTPVYDNDEPRESFLDRIYLISHGRENKSVRIEGAAAVSLVMANCIQQNWGTEITTGLLDSLTSMCSSVEIYKLDFVPDKSVMEYISKI